MYLLNDTEETARRRAEPLSSGDGWPQTSPPEAVTHRKAVARAGRDFRHDVPRLGEAHEQADMVMMTDVEVSRSLAAAHRGSVNVAGHRPGFAGTPVSRFRNSRDRCGLRCMQRRSAQSGDGEKKSE